MSSMRWEKSPATSALTRSRPYQGVRVRDPVKELLRRKRTLDSIKTAPPAVDDIELNNPSPYAQVTCSSSISSSSGTVVLSAGNGGSQTPGWRAACLQAGAAAGLQSSLTPWAPPEHGQQDPSGQNLAHPAAALSTDLYMQTLCPSYTMLTYTHAPTLLTNFGTIPVGPAPAQVELQDSGLTYLPWTQPLATISTNTGVQFASGATALSGPPLVHMPLSMSVTTMIPQLEPQAADAQSQALGLQQLHPQAQVQSLDEDAGMEPASPNLLDKLLEEKREEDAENIDSFRNSIFLPNV